jgi:WD repeat-containing protein 45
MRFNQDDTCFSIGTTHGFRVFGVEPMEERIRHGEGGRFGLGVSIDPSVEVKEGGVGLVELLYRTNYMALVGGGPSPAWAPNRVILWEDRAGKIVKELEFKTTDVKNVKMTRDRLVAVLRNKLFLWTLAENPQKVAAYETCDNEQGSRLRRRREGAYMCSPI